MGILKEKSQKLNLYEKHNISRSMITMVLKLPQMIGLIYDKCTKQWIYKKIYKPIMVAFHDLIYKKWSSLGHSILKLNYFAYPLLYALTFGIITIQ